MHSYSTTTWLLVGAAALALGVLFFRGTHRYWDWWPLSLMVTPAVTLTAVLTVANQIHRNDTLPSWWPIGGWPITAVMVLVALDEVVHLLRRCLRRPSPQG